MDLDKIGHETQEVDSYRGGTDVKILKTRAFGIVAGLAVEMASRWGMVAAQPDGEDSNGRQKLRCLSPNEIVSKAINTAEMLYEELSAKGLIAEIPLPRPHRTEDEEEAFRTALRKSKKSPELPA